MVKRQRAHRWPGLWACVLTAALTVSPGVCTAAAAAGDGDRARVVLLFGAPDVGVWQRVFTAEFLGHPAMDDGQPPVSVAMEYLSLADADAPQLNRTLGLLAYRQATEPAAVVVAVQSVAARFVIEHGDQLYPGVPRLLVLPGRALASQVADRPDYRVIASAVGEAISGTLGVIRQLLPEVRSVYLIGGAGELDQAYLAYAHEALDGHTGSPALEYLVGLGLPALQRRLRDAPADSVALLLTYERDPSGASYRTSLDVLPRLREASAIPIFGAYDSLLGAGVAGGIMTSTKRYGQQTAAAVLDLIAGREGPAATALAPAVRTAFDARVLEELNVPLDRLPADAELINHSRPAYLAYLRELLVGLAIMAIQAFMIVGLWTLWRQRSRALQALEARAEEVIRQKGLFESVIGSIPDAIVVSDVDGVIIASNDRGFQETFGMAPERALGRHCRELVDGEAFARLEHALQQAPGILDFVAGNGDTFPGEWAGTRVLAETGEHLGYVLLVRDVTERMAQEEERRQAHKMEALGSLAGGIAHDFNNILTAILGSAELILAGAEPAEQADHIMRAGNRARALVNQILAFSRHGTMPESAAVCVRALLDEAVRFLRTTLPGSVQLCVDIPDDFDAVVAGNENQLHQVLMNLFVNARDALQDQQRMRQRAPCRLGVRVERWTAAQEFATSHGLLAPGDYVVVAVSDTGPGMNPSVQRRVFDPFFTTKSPGQGTGMGLALVYGIMRAHGGAIDVASSAGQGSRFVLYLPLLDPDAPAPAAGTDLAAALRPVAALPR